MSAGTERLRQLQAADAEALHAIDLQGNLSPWTAHQYRQSLETGDYGLGLEAEATLIAFALFNSVLDETTLVNIGVLPQWRRHGCARRLLGAALTALGRQGMTRCLLEVRESNRPAIALYRDLGFRVDGVRRGYYPLLQGREDGLLMSMTLPPVASHQLTER